MIALTPYGLFKERRTEVCANRFRYQLALLQLNQSSQTEALLSYLLHGLDGLAGEW